MKIFYVGTILLFLSIANYCQTIPEQKPNIRLHGIRQGEWVIWQTARWSPTDIPDSVVYYRKLFFKDGIPVGTATDYYRNGKPQWQGKLISFEPDKIDGKAKWYYPNGNIKDECSFVDGKKQGEEITYFESGKISSKAFFIDDELDGYVTIYYENGNIKTTGSFNKGKRIGKWVWYFESGKIDNETDYRLKSKEDQWSKMMDEVDDLEKAKKVKEAIESAKKAQRYAKEELGTNHKDYVFSIERLALLYQNNLNYELALPLFKEAMKVVENWLGKDHPEYGICLYNLAGLYQSIEQYQKALPLYLEALQNYERSLGKSNSKYGDCLNNLAYLYQSMGLYNKALPLYQEALLNTEKTLGKLHADYGTGLHNLAELYNSMGQYEKALPLYLEALENIKNTQGKEQPAYGICLSNLAGLYKNMGQYEKALPLYFEALTSVEKSLGKANLEYGNCLNNLALLYMETGKYEKAEKMYEEALKIIEKSSGKNNASYGNGLNNLAVLYTTMGQYKKALPLLLEALKSTEKSTGKDHYEYGTCLNNVAELYRYMGWYDKALPLSLEALTIAEKTLGKDHPEYGTSLNNLAELYKSMGQYDKALPLSLEALQNAEKSLGKDHSSYGLRLNNLANLYRHKGQFDKALPLYLEALKNTENSLGNTHFSYGVYLDNLAKMYENMGQYEKAEKLFKEALDNGKNSLGKQHSNYGAYLDDLAGLYCDIGRYEEAKPLYMEALNNTEKAVGKEHTDYGNCLNNLAILYMGMENYKDALPLYLEALEITKKASGKDHSDYGFALNNLSVLYDKMGLFEKALPLQQEALVNLEKTIGKEHPGYATSLNNIAGLYQKMGENKNALPLYKEASDVIFKNIGKNFRFLSEKDKAAYVEKVNFYFEIYNSFYLKCSHTQPSLAADAYNIELATKGMILNSGTEMRENLIQSGNASAIKTYDDWNTLKAALAKQYSLPVSERDDNIPLLEEQSDKLEAELTRVSSSFKQSKSLLETKWNAVQHVLKAGEVAIEFTSFNYHNDKTWADSVMYVALVLRKDDIYPLMIPLCEVRQLDSLLKKDGASDANFVSNLYRGTELLEKESFSYGQRLYELIWKPLDSLLQKGNKIFFAPSGLLHQIAFAAVPYNKEALLSDRYNLNQLSSTAMLLRESSFKKEAPQSMLVFGGIQYDATKKEILEIAQSETSSATYVSRSLPSDINRGGKMEYLPGTLSEATAIVSIAEKNKIEVKAYFGLNALEERYKKAGYGNAPQVIHIATHGFFFPDPKTEKKDMTNYREEDKLVFKYSENPLNRSGLLFAGANNAWNGTPVPGVEDGILTAYEAANVSLSKTQLVVLSACETGLGDIKGSEGVFGLQRAFKMAGTEYLMMSLWKVPDNETGEFMKYFYTTWFSGKTIPDAFIETQKFMRSKYSDNPYKWAAFVLVK